MTTRLAILAGALFSVACVLLVGHRNPSGSLVALFVLWVFLPFGLLGWLGKRAAAWARPQAVVFQRLSLAICIASAAVYGAVAAGLSTAKPAFWFLILPAASLAVIAAFLALSKPRVS